MIGIAPVAVASSVSGPDFSPRTLLRDYMVVSQMMDQCPEIASDRRMSDKKKQFLTAGEYLVDSLSRRASTIKPGLTNAAARGLLQQWMSRQAGNFGNEQLCNMASTLQLGQYIDTLSAPSTLAQLQHYAMRTDVEIKPLPLTSKENLKTYASPHFQAIALLTIAQSHSKGICRTPNVTSVRLIKKTPKEIRNRPVFIASSLHIVERWDYDCGGRKGRVELTFSRDNDGIIGPYQISDK
ncbi:hypothetical protein [Cohaesibacter celericrescens]|uniref:hypothetical protein n=1 Tax=Cohaesibacter celericrescens TaxID=2067669 RepID=UPI003564ADD9